MNCIRTSTLSRLTAKKTVVIIIISSFFFFGQTSAQQSMSVEGLSKMTFEELMHVKVISASKQPETFQDVATSIYVLSADDIRRSGATRLIELLNMVPGAWFQEFTYNLSVNAIRTNTDEYPQSMLVLLDGVPINNPITGGPMYNYIDIPVQQIERIEVIKGPGGTIYGANANTGIVSIYTRKANGSEGLLVSLNAGLQDYLSPFVRYTHKLSEKADISGYANFITTRGYDKTDAFVGDLLTVPNNGQDTVITNKFTSDETDGRRSLSGGLHLQVDLADNITSSSRLFYDNGKADVYTYAKMLDSTWIAEDAATNLILSERFDVSFNNRHSLFLHFYYWSQIVDVAGDGGWKPHTRTLDFEFQDNYKFGFNDLSFGGNYRDVKFMHENGTLSDMTYIRTHSSETLYALFVQNKMSYRDKLDLILGVKAETWTLADDDPEYSPSLRIALKPRKDLTIWTAISRSITTPGYFHLNLEQRFADLSGDGSLYAAIVPIDRIKPTTYRTAEFGIRTSILSKTHLDFSMFYAEFDDAITLDRHFMTKDPVQSQVGNYMIMPMYFTNTFKGKRYGGEFVARVNPYDNYRAELSYSVNKVEVEGIPIPNGGGAKFSISDPEEPVTPEHIIRLRQDIDFPQTDIYMTFDAMWASTFNRGAKYDYVLQNPDGENSIFVDPPESILKINFNIEKKFFDDRLAVNLWGRNILADDYVEFYSQFIAAGYPHTIHRTFGCAITYILP